VSTSPPDAEQTLVASPLALAGAAIVAVGVARRSALLILAGGLAIGLGLKLRP
jgi:hypothetical protein